MRIFFSSRGLRLFVRTVQAAALGICLACSSKSPEEKLLDQAKTVSSWVATLRMTGEQWNANSIPTSFVETTGKAARKELETAAEETAKSKAPQELRAPLQQTISEAVASAKGVRRAAETGDHPGMAREIGRLASLQARLEALQKQHGEGSP